ncbi:hypothetical protein SLEP1_g20182 [Rubroshorea leprosula]|uniref:TIR domain-containing protein n=1 Tax=Rubroshorea leprosula TaxID=152421 RepID=A0AAV5J1U8_9ROSI|nr:hypothetical protein SLEP1_g20182 [Rubroshorea leprosula]
MGEVNEIDMLQYFIYYSLWLLLPFYFISVHRRKYDVFISYRSKDVRHNFLTHLRCALKKGGFRVFVDENDIQRGCDIATELPKAIQQSRIALVLLSENYAGSGWCLDELVNILDCRERLGQIVLPIFFHVRPSNVRHQNGRFGDAFARLHEASVEEMEKRKNALYHITNLAGFNLGDVNGIMLRMGDMVFRYSVRFGYHSAYALQQWRKYQGEELSTDLAVARKNKMRKREVKERKPYLGKRSARRTRFSILPSSMSS